MLTTVALPGALLLAAMSSIPAEKFPTLPEGVTGIAAKYRGDKGIDQDPAVVFADDFESHASVADLRTKWDVLTHEELLSIVDGTDNELGGAKSLLLTIPQQDAPLGAHVDKLLTETQDVLFLRWYQRFDDAWMVPGGSVHNGGSISAKYVVEGRATPGIRADGRNKLLVNFENENATGDAPGWMNVYVYWPEQGDRWGDHFYPSGTVFPFSHTRSGAVTFGEQFKAHRDFSPTLGRWYCYEYMVKANTPGQRNGRIAMWVDGRLIADFPNLRFRDIEDLKIDRFGLGVYISNNARRLNRKWFDNVVAATSYIGPVAPSK
jgi:hypothetical protein